MKLIKITELISLAESELKKFKYTESGTKTHTRVWEDFKKYALKYETIYYTEELLMAYMEEILKAFSNPGQVPSFDEKLRAIKKLNECYRYGTLSSNRYSNRKTYDFCGHIGNSVIEYLVFRSTNVSEARLQSLKLYLERFCYYTDSLNLKNINDLYIDVLQGFILSCGLPR